MATVQPYLDDRSHDRAIQAEADRAAAIEAQREEFARDLWHGLDDPELAVALTECTTEDLAAAIRIAAANDAGLAEELAKTINRYVEGVA